MAVWDEKDDLQLLSQHVSTCNDLRRSVAENTLASCWTLTLNLMGKWKLELENAIRPYEDLLTSMKRRKLKWYVHVTRSSGLAKTVLQGTVQGGRRRGRQRKRWEDIIKEWTGLEWNIILRKAENREDFFILKYLSSLADIIWKRSSHFLQKYLKSN